MSFELSGIVFSGKDTFEQSNHKMKEYYSEVGKRLIGNWIEMGINKGYVERNNFNEIYKWMKVLDEFNFNCLVDEC